MDERETKTWWLILSIFIICLGVILLFSYSLYTNETVLVDNEHKVVNNIKDILLYSGIAIIAFGGILFAIFSSM
jgi:drug/metabolite transporter (DMT)-like permease